MLKTQIKLTQSKKASTQYISIPAAVVQDSQYPFEDTDELYLEIEPKTGTMILTKTPRTLTITSKGLTITTENPLSPDQTTLIEAKD
ncbi:MAG: hypothetical protein ACTSU7_11400 [Candidatus Heimdallarchaeaceae archaeon]